MSAMASQIPTTLPSGVVPGPKERAPITPLGERRVVFVSHANPEDNAIAAWYGARLAAAGFEVWTDLTRLLGGEEMWLDIDNALRFHARKVVALLSRAAVAPIKEGVRAEIDRAAAYRKKLEDRRFVIPVKIDDVPYEDLPPTIANRTIIDGSGNHAVALSAVLKILEEDSVGRAASPASNALTVWQQAYAPQNTEPEAVEDTLVSNWFPLVSLPDEVHFYDIGRPLKNPVTEPATIARDHPLPMAAHWRKLVSFASWDEVQEPIQETTPVTLEHSMSLEDMLSGGDARFPFSDGAGGKMLASLVRQAWDKFCRDAGLEQFPLSESKDAWYVPRGLVSEDKVDFVRVSGVRGWRQLGGVYGARERNWHFGANGSLMLGAPLRLRLSPHVVYTDPKGEKEPTADFRRAHCKLWYNAKWRDLLYAYTTYLADENGRLSLPFGREAAAVFSASPLSVTLPVRPPLKVERSQPTAAAMDGDAPDTDIAELADDPIFSRLIDDEDDVEDIEDEET